MRAAYYHRNIELVLRLSGMTNAACKKELLTLHESMAELGSRIMGNGLLMSKMGLLNQRNAGLEHATALIAASRNKLNKASEEEKQETYDLAGTFAAALAAQQPPITEAERQALQATARAGKFLLARRRGQHHAARL